MYKKAHRFLLALALAPLSCEGNSRSIGAIDEEGTGGDTTGAETGNPEIDCPQQRVWEGEFHPVYDLADLAGYTEVTGHVEIEGASEDDLWNLQCLQRVGGNLRIIVSHDLTHVDMFQSLEYVGGTLLIDLHDNLENLNGFANLKHARSLELDLNPKLADISGLAKVAPSLEDLTISRSGVVSLAPLAGIGSQKPLGLLQVQENPDLVDLSGLSEVTHINALNLHYNDSLESLHGLEALEYCEADFEIGPLPKLKDLDPIDPRIDGSLQHVGNAFIRDNPILPQCAVDYLLEGVEVAAIAETSGMLDCECNGPVCK